MTEESGTHIRDLLLLSQDTIQDNVQRQMQGDGSVAQTRVAWGFVGSKATQAIDSVLDKDVFEVVAEAWEMVDVLIPYADEKKHPRGERSLVPLLHHSFVKVCHPVLDVMWGDTQCASLKFDLELAANFRSVVLTICDGYIVSADGVDADVSATLKYGDATVATKKSPKVQLLRHKDFRAPGVAILRTPPGGGVPR